MSSVGPLPERGVGPAPVPGTPTPIAPSVLRVTAPNPSMMTGPGTNSYLVGDEQIVVIDPGPDLPEHRAALLEAIDGRRVLAVAVTHTHPDHAPGAGALASAVGAPTAGFDDGPAFTAERRLVDGDLLGDGIAALRVLHTPGHASNHVCFLIEAQGLLFTGDHLMEASTVVIRPPDGDLGSYLSSLERLARLTPSLQHLAPGHGRVMADPLGAIDDVIEHRMARHELVASALHRHQRATAATLLGEVYPDIGDDRHAIATATLWAHLRLLAESGRATVRQGSPDDEDAVFESVGEAS